MAVRQFVDSKLSSEFPSARLTAQIVAGEFLTGDYIIQKLVLTLYMGYSVDHPVSKVQTLKVSRLEKLVD